MALFWVLLSFLAIGTVLGIADHFCGRGHLGAPQSQSHYLDEVEVWSRTVRF